MAILAFTFFAAVMIAALWTIVATIRPQFARIVDLLVHGPVAMESVPLTVASRSRLRDVRVISVGSRPAPAAMRAAA